MSETANLKTKLGLNVFKPDAAPHIHIKEDCGGDPVLQRAVRVCPAGLYTLKDNGTVEFTIDGCLECGTCRIACGTKSLDWSYPSGGSGVQFRFG